MTDKELYKRICETEGERIPLFLQYWWMETVCAGKEWDVALATDGDKVLAVMPFLHGRKFAMNYVLQPQLTQYSGPCYFYPDGMNAQQRLEFEKQVARELLRKVERLNPVVFIQNFSPQVTNWLPFCWAGYSQTTRYTYRIEDISDPQRVFAAFDAEKRQRKIRRYEQKTTVGYDMTAADFSAFHRRYWESKGRKDLLPQTLIERVCRTAAERGNGVTASLYDDQGRLLCSHFVAYDSRCAYALMSAVDMSLHRSGHNETLIWALLQHLSTKSKSFDFEGSMDEGIEYFYRSFGATQTPFFQISKCSKLVRPFVKV